MEKAIKNNFQEREIKGVLHWRKDFVSQFIPYSPEELTHRIAKAEKYSELSKLIAQKKLNEELLKELKEKNFEIGVLTSEKDELTFNLKQLEKLPDIVKELRERLIAKHQKYQANMKEARTEAAKEDAYQQLLIKISKLDSDVKRLRLLNNDLVAQIVQLKRENEEWKGYFKSAQLLIHDLQTTIDRMKAEHSSQLEAIKS